MFEPIPLITSPADMVLGSNYVENVIEEFRLAGYSNHLRSIIMILCTSDGDELQMIEQRIGNILLDIPPDDVENISERIDYACQILIEGMMRKDSLPVTPSPN